MSIKTQLLNFIREKPRTTGEVFTFGYNNYCATISRRARELRDEGLIEIKRMTEDEKYRYRVKSGSYLYRAIYPSSLFKRVGINA